MAGSTFAGRPFRSDDQNALIAAIGGRLRQLRQACGWRTIGRRKIDRKNIATDLPQRLGINYRSWLNWEQGATVPGHQLLAVLVATGVRPAWLLSGDGPMFDGDYDRAIGCDHEAA